MGNCLVTKLKESVQNAELLKMGEWRFTNTSSSEIKGSIGAANGGITIIPLEGTIYAVAINGDKPGTPITQPIELVEGISDGRDLWISAGGKIAVLNYYNMSRILQNIFISVDNFNYLKNPIVISINSGDLLKCNLDKLATVTDLYLRNVNASAEVLAQLKSHFAALKSISINSSYATGNIKNFVLPITNGIHFGNDCTVNGSIEEFVAAYRSAGYTEKAIKISFNTNAVSFNGNPTSAYYTDLSWTASSITFNGVTINA